MIWDITRSLNCSGAASVSELLARIIHRSSEQATLSKLLLAATRITTQQRHRKLLRTAIASRSHYR
jgi:hypothetical protein